MENYNTSSFRSQIKEKTVIHFRSIKFKTTQLKHKSSNNNNENL